MKLSTIRAIRLTIACCFALQLACVCFADLPDEIRVLTYNIHHGEGVDGRLDLPRVAKVIKSVLPHLVALQEVDQGTRRAGGVDQPAELSRLTGMEVVFGRNIDYDGGGYGTAVLSSLPIRSHESFQLRSFYEGTAKHPEQRGVQLVEIGAKDGPTIIFLCTHLDYRPPDDERMASAATINKLAEKRGDTLMILAGDLNAEPDSRPMRELAKRWTIAGHHTRPGLPILTYPAEKPAKWIDFILVRPKNRWQVVEVRVLDEPVASDHRPLLAVLRGVTLKP